MQTISLTENNLLHFGNQQQRVNMYNKETLQRYYQDVNFFDQDSAGLNSYQPPYEIASTLISDTLTLDIHSLSEEKVYYKSCSLTPKSSFVSECSQASYDCKSYSMINDNESEYSIPSLYHDRRSLPAKLYKKESFRELRRVPSLEPYSTALVHQKEEKTKSKNISKQATGTKDDTIKRKKTWLRRILKVFNKNRSKQTNEKGPVWYCQYSKNPTSCIESYYKNQQLNILS